MFFDKKQMVLKMKINKYLVFFMVLLFAMMSVAVASDVNETSTQEVLKDTTVSNTANVDDNIASDTSDKPANAVNSTEKSITKTNDKTSSVKGLPGSGTGDNPETHTTLTDGETYENAIITLDADASFNYGIVTFKNNVTLESVNSTNVNTLTNLKIVVNGDNITVNNVNFTYGDTTTDTKVFDIDHSSNVTLNNTNIDLDKTTANHTKAVSVTNSTNVIITNSNINVNSAALAIDWQSDDGWITWYSVLKVSGIIIDQSTDVTVSKNNITMTNSTSDLSGTTMPAITIRYSSTNINISDNNISSTGAQHVYGIMGSDMLYDIIVKNNNISVSGLYHVVGIDLSTANNSVICKNTITGRSENATDFPEGYESLAYGIVSDGYGSGNTNNKICSNTLDLLANVNYVVEVFMGDNITICSNNITATGNKTTGVAFAFTNDSKIINNNMNITGTTTDNHTFITSIPPHNMGTQLMNQSNNNLIQGNCINLTVHYDYNAKLVNLTNDTLNTVQGNYLKLDYGSSYCPTGNQLITSDNSGNTYGDDNMAVILYECNCTCCYTTSDLEITTITTLPNHIKSTKKDEQETSTYLLITDDNLEEYADSIQGTSVRIGNKLTNVTDLTINITKNVDMFFFYKEFDSLQIYYEKNIQLIPDYTNKVFTRAKNIYAPTAMLQGSIGEDMIASYVNCTVLELMPQSSNKQIIVENCTLISVNGISGIAYWDNNKSIVTNSYIVSANPRQNQYSLGSQIGEKYTNSTYTNVTPNYTDYKILNSTTYSIYFDEETHILKDEYENTVLFAFETITEPVIINKPVTLSAVRGMTGYNNVTFIEGSDNSVIEDSLIGTLTINTANNIKVNNNQLLSQDSSINVINSIDCIIENNTVNTQNTYTITFDEDSLGNTVKNNILIANEYTGDKSVQTSDDNTVEDNTPKYIEPSALKVDTTEFTIGTTATITASIYQGDEIITTINNGKVVFKVNGKTLKDSNGKVIYAKVVNGTATIENYTIPTSWNKDGLTISAVYSGSSQCDALRSTAEEITIIQSQPTITTEDITATIAETITLKATITDGSNIINNGKVVFKVNGKTVKDVSGKTIYAKISNGIASVEYTIPDSYKAKNYTITATFIATGYDKLVDTKTLTITA